MVHFNAVLADSNTTCNQIVVQVILEVKKKSNKIFFFLMIKPVSVRGMNDKEMSDT